MQKTFFLIASLLLICFLGVVVCLAATADAATSSQQDRGAIPRPSAESQLLFHARDPKTGVYGYVDQRGMVSIPFQFDLAFPFGDDGFAVTSMKAPPEARHPYRASIINRKGDTVFSGGHIIQPMGRGRFAVEEEENVRFVSFFEPFAVALKCTQVRWGPSEGMFAVGVNGKWGFINDKGDVIIPPKYDGVRPFTEGLAAAVSGDKWGYIDHSDNWAIQPQFEGAYQFRDGLASVSHAGRSWYIDHTGKRAFERDYVRVQDFAEGLGCFYDEKTDLWGYVDTSGTVVIPAALRFARPFSEGLALARNRNGEAGYIDHTGKFVIKLPEKPITFGDFTNGRANVTNEDRTGYIDRSGAWIWTSLPVPGPNEFGGQNSSTEPASSAGTAR